MTESIHDYMQIGIVQFMMYPECFGGKGPQVETITKLATNPYFDFLEIGPISNASVRKEVSSVLSQARVQAVFDGQPQTLIPGLDLESADENERQQAISAMKEAIDQASEFGSTTCGVMSGKAYPSDLNIELATARLADSLKELCEYALPKEITLCLENFDRVPFSKDCLIGPTVEAVKLSEMVRTSYDNFGLLLDLSHTPIMKETPREMVEIGRDHIVRTQIGNASANPYSQHYGDNHAYFGAPLTGVSIEDLAEFIRALMEVGFLTKEKRGMVGFEVKPLASENPEAVTAGSIRALNEAWKMI